MGTTAMWTLLNYELTEDVQNDEHGLDLALAAGYLLRTKAEGWKLRKDCRDSPGDVVP